MPTIWQRIARFSGGEELSPERQRSILSRRNHSPYVNRHRATVINNRIRIIALAFAGLTAVWMPLDFWFLPRHTAESLAVLRILSTALFIYLAVARERRNTQGGARMQLALLLFNPLLFYLASQWLFAGADFSGLAGVFVGIYELLPFIIVAGLSVFPLTLLESVGFGGTTLLAMAVGPLLAGHFLWQNYAPALWALLLLLGVCVLASAIQLNYMMSLLHRVSSDRLTGAFSRDSGHELLDLYFRIALEQKTPFALAFIDLDHFKSINDTYGHEAGDEALKGAVAMLRRHLRLSDMVVRWGGEEFIVLLPGMQTDGIRGVMQRLTHGWLGERPDGAPLTASIGIAERIADDVADWPQLLELADKRMYQAKTTGRARAVMCGGDVVLPETTSPQEAPTPG